MTITLPPDLESAVVQRARENGISAEALVISAVRAQMDESPRLPQPRDDWERLVLSLGTNCGVSLPPEALTSEGLYE